MLGVTTWPDVAIEVVKQLAAILGAAAILLATIYKFWIRDFKKKQDESLENQKRLEAKANIIEQKNDGNHAKALEAVKETSRENVEQLIRAVEKVLNAQSAQSKQRGRRRTDPP